ncbi:hypothetical protein J2S82_000967 [Aeromonas caviae]|nr:hypothetical protein [Aeromonas caviae]
MAASHELSCRRIKSIHFLDRKDSVVRDIIL